MRIRLTAILAAIAAFGTAATAAADPPYPATPPTFRNLPTGADPFFSARGAATNRPLLVIVTEFNGAPAPADVVAQMTNRYFGSGTGNTSVGAWYREQSFGRLNLRPARERAGTADDGIVVVNAGD